MFALDKFYIGLLYELALQEVDFPCFLVLLPRHIGPQLVTGFYAAAPPYPFLHLFSVSFLCD